MEKNIFVEVFKFLEKYSNHQLKENEWQDCMDDAIAINRKYSNPFCSKLVAIAFCRVCELQQGESIDFSYEKGVFRENYNFFVKYSGKKFNDKDWTECIDDMVKVNRTNGGAFNSKILATVYCHLVRLQDKKETRAWQDSEIRRFCMGKKKKTA